MSPLVVTYRFPATPSEAADFAHALLLEQTIETPLAVARFYPQVEANRLGKVLAVESCGDGTFLARLELPSGTALTDPAQWLNVIFGNASLHAGVYLEDVEVPEAMRAALKGPTFGIEGLRSRAGVHNRPLVCSALKPAGLTTGELALLATRFAEGGIDYLKDDHYLSSQPEAPFEDRVRAIVDALEEVAARTGHRTRYVANLSGGPLEVLEQAKKARDLGADAVLVAPMLVGLPTMRYLADTLHLPIFAHPAFCGNGQVPHPLLMGRLFRLYGADAVIFAGYGGRFNVPQAVCASIAEQARAWWNPIRPSIPVPAGGMTRDRASELVHFYGQDTMLLIGGSLLESGPHLASATAALMEAVRNA